MGPDSVVTCIKTERMDTLGKERHRCSWKKDLRAPPWCNTHSNNMSIRKSGQRPRGELTGRRASVAREKLVEFGGAEPDLCLPPRSR